MKVKKMQEKLWSFNQEYKIEILINGELKEIKKIVPKDGKISITCKSDKKQDYTPIGFKIR